MTRIDHRLALALLALLMPLAGACSDSTEDLRRRRRLVTETEETVDPEDVEPTAWLEYERDTEDFGEVYQAAVRETTFEMVAAGEDPIVLGNLRRTCGCTEGELYVLADDGTKEQFLPGDPYPPGTRFELRAILNTLGKQGDQDQKVHLDIEGQPLPTTFTMKAQIVTFLVLDPPQLTIDDASTLKGASGELGLESRGGERFALDVRREVLPDELSIELTPVEPDADGRAPRWTLAFQIAPGVPRGPYKQKLILVTDEVNEEAAPLPIGGQPTHTGEIWLRTDVKGVFDMRPERLNFGRLQPDQSLMKKVLVHNLDPEFEMTQIDVGLFERSGEPYGNVESFEIEVTETDPGRTWQIEILLSDPPSGDLGGLLGIRTFHPLESELAIPFVGKGPSN